MEASKDSTHHRYEVLAPTKHSKGKKYEQKTVVLSIGISIILLCIIIILATVFATLASKKENEDALLLVAIESEANRVLKKIIPMGIFCKEKSSQGKCFYARTLVSDCKIAKCVAYNHELSHNSFLMETKFLTKQIEFHDVPNGVPCGKSKVCYNKTCVDFHSETLKDELRNALELTSNGSYVETQMTESSFCTKTNFKLAEHEDLFKRMMENKYCMPNTQTGLRLQVFSCENAFGTKYPCGNTEKTNIKYPLMYKRVAQCPEKEVDVYSFSTGGCTVNFCKYTCNDDVSYVSEPYKCEKGNITGYCLLGVCIPEFNTTQKFYSLL